MAHQVLRSHDPAAEGGHIEVTCRGCHRQSHRAVKHGSRRCHHHPHWYNSACPLALTAAQAGIVREQVMKNETLNLVQERIGSACRHRTKTDFHFPTAQSQGTSGTEGEENLPRCRAPGARADHPLSHCQGMWGPHSELQGQLAANARNTWK